MPKARYIILFHSIHDVLRAEKVLKERSIAHELVPIPRNLSADCGMCVELNDDIATVYELLKPIPVAGVYSCSTGETIPVNLEKIS
ncbi:MAG: DUF3343 domain-containing protein [Syntrophorhabdaceae bacterium]